MSIPNKNSQQTKDRTSSNKNIYKAIRAHIIHSGKRLNAKMKEKAKMSSLTTPGQQCDIVISAINQNKQNVLIQRVKLSLFTDRYIRKLLGEQICSLY